MLPAWGLWAACARLRDAGQWCGARLRGCLQGNPAHITQREPGGPWEADPLIWDERWVAAKVRRASLLRDACVLRELCLTFRL